MINGNDDTMGQIQNTDHVSRAVEFVPLADKVQLLTVNQAITNERVEKIDDSVIRMNSNLNEIKSSLDALNIHATVIKRVIYAIGILVGTLGTHITGFWECITKFFS